MDADLFARQQNYPAYNQSTIDGLKLVASGHMDAFRVSFFTRARAEMEDEG